MNFLVGLSGGLDSASAAKMLLENNHRVEGVYLRMFEGADSTAAVKTSEELGIRLHILDCQALFKEKVIRNFIESYKKGITPNPCVECNRHVKIAVLCDYAKEHGFDKVVTGHYGKIIETGEGRFCVLRSENEKKDQSYMLWALTQEQLSMLHLPLYAIDKNDLRVKARQAGMISANAKESMDICFLTEGDYASFIEKQEGSFPEGEFVDADGRFLGTHKGIVHYTVGQRKHLGIALGSPVYVSKIEPETNRITLVPAGAEYQTRARVGQLNFQMLPPQEEGDFSGLTVKMRYAQKPVPVSVHFEENEALLTFEEPVRAITPGQSAVFYLENRLAFGGYIL